MNPRAKQKLIDWLFNMIGTKHFSMSDLVGSTAYYYESTPMYECGTTLCLLGAAEAFAFHQDISSDRLAKIDCYSYLDELQTFYSEDYDAPECKRGLEWLGLDTDSDWPTYPLFFHSEWPQPYQKIYLGKSNICKYVVNSKDIFGCNTFYRPLAGILLLTDMPDDEDGYLDGMECDDDESFYKRHEELIQRCISKFRTSL